MKLSIKKINITTTANETCIMLILNYFISSKSKPVYIDVDSIGHFLTGRFLDRAKDKRLISNIKDGLDGLINRKIIKKIASNKDNYILDLSNIYIDKDDNYTIVMLNEVRTIFNSLDVDRPFLLLYFFIGLVSAINNDTKEWHMSQADMINKFNIGSYDTINNYLNILQDLKLIYVHKSNRRLTDGTYRSVTNSYGRYEDKDQVILESSKYIDTLKTELIYSEINRGAIRQRYNAFVKGSKKYVDNPNLVVMLYKDCFSYNKSLDNKPIQDNKNGFKPKELIDLSVFDSFKFKLNVQEEI